MRFLLNDTERFVENRRAEFHAMGVRMSWIGRRDWRVPKRITRTIDETIELTKNNPGMTLTIAFNYGGRAELVDAARAIASDAKRGRVDPARIDERTIHRALYDPALPDVDLFLRTGGEHRVSNYLLWQSSYAELVFLDVLWPDFDEQHLRAAIDEYRSRRRRFGKRAGRSMWKRRSEAARSSRARNAPVATRRPCTRRRRRMTSACMMSC